jgi:hypothetical protein
MKQRFFHALALVLLISVAVENDAELCHGEPVRWRI